jgi:hypothetical protein
MVTSRKVEFRLATQGLGLYYAWRPEGTFLACSFVFPSDFHFSEVFLTFVQRDGPLAGNVATLKNLLHLPSWKTVLTVAEQVFLGQEGSEYLKRAPT